MKITMASKPDHLSARWLWSITNAYCSMNNFQRTWMGVIANCIKTANTWNPSSFSTRRVHTVSSELPQATSAGWQKKTVSFFSQDYQLLTIRIWHPWAWSVRQSFPVPAGTCRLWPEELFEYTKRKCKLLKFPHVLMTQWFNSLKAKTYLSF